MDKTIVSPKITAYSSVLLILSELVKRGKTVLRQDKLVPILYQFKDAENTRVLFEDIAFKNRVDTITSVDIEDSLCKLQTYGAIGRLNPAYEKIVVYISRKEADEFIDSYDHSFVEAAQIVSEAFNNENA